jgi:carbon starvation protein CstA
MMLAGLIPKWAYWSCFALFFAILLPLVFWSNAHQHRIQVEEGTCGGHERGLVYASRPGGHGRFAGPIFGGTLWLLILTAFARDWVSFTGLILCDLLLLLGATTLYRRDPQRYWSVSILTACTLMAMMLTAINLRWTAWMHAYRQSSAYDPGNDFSLTTINLVLLGLVVALVTLFATQYARRKTTNKDRTTGSCAR